MPVGSGRSVGQGAWSQPVTSRVVTGLLLKVIPQQSMPLSPVAGEGQREHGHPPSGDSAPELTPSRATVLFGPENCDGRAGCLPPGAGGPRSWPQTRPLCYLGVVFTRLWGVCDPRCAASTGRGGGKVAVHCDPAAGV